MTLLNPRVLAEELGGKWVNSAFPKTCPPPRGVTFHSERVRPGDIFFALPGALSHGIRHADEAIAQGAVMIVSDTPHPAGIVVADPAAALLQLGRRAREVLSGTVIGVTGSVGKTTTKELLAAVTAGRASPGNFNTPLALAETLVRAVVAEELTGETPHLILELGIDHTGEMAQLTALTRPEHAVITAIGPSHLDGLGDLAGVADEKGELFRSVRGVKVISQQAAHHLTPTLLRGATTVAVTPTLNRAGQATLQVGDAEVELPWSGSPVAQNAALAAAMALELGVPQATVIERLMSARLEEGRLTREELGAFTLIDDSYNSNPLSLKPALELLNLAPRPRVAFLGEMRELGPLSEREHLRMGEATRGLDLVVGVGPASALMKTANPNVLLATDSEDAQRYVKLVVEGATVLVKGSRGVMMETVVEALRERARSLSEREGVT